MTITDTDALSVAAPRPLLRTVGFIGLGVVVVGVSLSETLARVLAGGEYLGPPLAPPSAAFAFGTDLLGRNLASETMRGLAVTVDSAGLATLVTLIGGSLLGFIVARAPFALAITLRRLAGVLAALPGLFLAILLGGLGVYAAFSAGIAAAPIAFVRAFDRARSLGRSAHADFARATGAPASALLQRDLAYELRAGFVSAAARVFAAVTIILSTASFFGFGARPPNRDLGLMLAAARESYLAAWWTALFPALALVLLILFARLAAGLDEDERL